MEAYAVKSGTIDVDTISASAEECKLKALAAYMGWRFDYPDLYSRDEAWAKLMEYDHKVVKVVIEERSH